MKFYKYIVAVALALVIINPTLVFAQTQPATNTDGVNSGLPTYTGVESSIKDYLCTPSEPPDGKDLERCINRLYRFGITAGGVVLVFFVVIAGYLYITGGETAKGRAKAILMNAVVGMGVLLGSYVLLYFINPSLVAFKPIQPPIFHAEDIPMCDEIGLGDNECSISVNADEVVDRSASGGSYADCRGGIVPITGIPRVGSGSSICQELLTKMQTVLAQFKAQNPGYYFGISSTIRNTRAESQCHYAGNSKSGNCADTVLRTSAGARVPGNQATWGSLCRLLLNAGLALANETGASHQGCREPKTFQYTSGPHFHVYVPGN